MGFRRPSSAVVPGERCPAERGNNSRDPLVTVTSRGRLENRGTRTCGRCGAIGVNVRQSCKDGSAVTAWYYAPHNAPGRIGSTAHEPRDS